MKAVTGSLPRLTHYKLNEVNEAVGLGCSMGCILLKEMLVKSMQPAAHTRLQRIVLSKLNCEAGCCCVCSMGGILVKEMLVKSMQPGAPPAHARMQRQTRGLAFYATPHHGSWLADVGWNLRFLGASPAASVVHLKRGPQQEVCVFVALQACTALISHLPVSQLEVDVLLIIGYCTAWRSARLMRASALPIQTSCPKEFGMRQRIVDMPCYIRAGITRCQPLQVAAQEINKAVAQLHDAGNLEVLSFCESVPLSLVGLLPRVLVVPEETAFPGYGETAHVEADHIDACKPASREDPGYALLELFIQRIWQAHKRRQSEEDLLEGGG